jgi:hypothetical protein
MDQTILVREQIAAGSELVRRVNAAMPVSAAFWLKEIDEPRWYLYITSDALVDQAPRMGYKVVREVIDAMGEDPAIDLFQVKVLPSNDPLAQEATNVVRHLARNVPVQLGTIRFGGRAVEDVWIYPGTILDPVTS